MNCWTLTQFISFNAFYKKVNCFNNKFSPDCTICYKVQSWGLLCCQFSGFVVVFLVKSLILNPNLNGFVMQRLLTLGRYCYMFFLRYSWYTVNVLDVLSILQLVYYKYFCDFFFNSFQFVCLHFIVWNHYFTMHISNLVLHNGICGLCTSSYSCYLFNIFLLWLKRS